MVFPGSTTSPDYRAGRPRRWQLGAGDAVRRGHRARTPDRPEVVALRAWRLDGGEPETLSRIEWQTMKPSSSCFDPAGRRGSTREVPVSIFVRSGPARFGRTSSWRAMTFGYDGDAMPNVQGSSLEGSLGPTDTAGRTLKGTTSGCRRIGALRCGGGDRAKSPGTLVDGPGRSRAPGSNLGVPAYLALALTLRRAGSWYFAVGTMHPRDDWMAVTTHGTESVTFWPTGRPS